MNSFFFHRIIFTLILSDITLKRGPKLYTCLSQLRNKIKKSCDFYKKIKITEKIS